MKNMKLAAAGGTVLVLAGGCLFSPQPAPNTALQLRNKLELVSKLNADSFQSGVSPKAFVQKRREMTVALEEVSEICRAGPSTPEQGNQCALAAALRRTNDSAVNARLFQEAAEAWDLPTLRTMAVKFEGEVENNWPKYDQDVAGYQGAAQDQTPYHDMRLRIACVMQIAQGGTELKSHEEVGMEGRTALLAYYSAAAAAADNLNISAPSTDTCKGGDEGKVCRQARKETALGLACK